MKMNNLKYYIKMPSFLLILTLLSSPLPAQKDKNKDFISLYKNKEYKKAVENITRKLNSIYSQRVSKKRIPTDFISMGRAEEGINLNEVFRKRKASAFFIEENKELFNLHIYAGKCYYNLKQYDRALNHYYQALRFKSIEFQKDDAVFYDISQIYKKQKRLKPYRRTLETAYTLNPKKYEYSLELGEALYNTVQKKKAIYHYSRYIKSKSDALNPSIYLKIGNLSEDIGRYIDTVKYYTRYLKKKPSDGYIHFALGYLAFKRVGNYPLAITSFNRSLKHLPSKEIYRRSKANEYMGDIYRKELDFDKAKELYNKTIKYQDSILEDYKKRKKEILKIKDEIRKLKSSLLKNKDYDKFNEYEFKREEMGKIESGNRKKSYEYGRLNAGKVRWNLAESNERLGKLDEAVKYYRECISFSYNSNSAREKIIKLQLKIKRGY